MDRVIFNTNTFGTMSIPREALSTYRSKYNAADRIKVYYHNETRKASGLEPVSIDSIYRRSRCKANAPAGDSRGSARQLDRQ